MAMNLEAVLRIAAQVVGEENIRQLGTALRGVEGAAKDAKNSFKDVVNSSAFQAAAVAAAALGAAIVGATRQAIGFDTAMAGVKKAVGGLDDSGVKAIKAEIFDLARVTPMSQVAIAELYAEAAKAGVPRAELKAFAQDVTKIAVAFDMTAGEAGEALAKLKSNLGLTQGGLVDLADAMNALEDSSTSSAREITEFMLRSGNAGKQAGMSAIETAAFGSALISTGAAAEVASTSFNNMLKALSKGDSMTDRQVSALVKLGYAQKGAERIEADLTQAVERESESRVRAIEAESRQVISEINRRYRDIMTITQRGWDDEDKAWSRRQDDRYESLEKSLQRERQAEIDASNERAKASGTDNSREIQQIEDRYDERFKVLRRRQEDEKTEYERGMEDRRQVTKDALDDEKEMELDAAEQKFEELKRIEELRKKEAIANAKETAKAMVGELGPKMAQMLQKDAVGTIRDVFDRIRKLPKEMQMSVISDLFGDEARALLPLIENSKLLDDALALVGDKANYAGSSAAAYAAKLETTEAKLQMFWNRVNEVAIVLGESFLPAIEAVLKVFAPFFEGLSWAIANIPLLGPVIAVVTAGFVALVALAPFVASFVTIAQGLAGLGLGATIAGWAGAIGPALSGIVAAFTSFFAANLAPTFAAVWGTIKFALMDFLATPFAQRLLFSLGQIAGTVVRFFAGGGLMTAFQTGLKILGGFLSGPVGWALLAAGLIALLIQFREPITKFFVWVGETISGWIAALWEWGEPIRQFWADLWTQVTQLTAPFFNWIGEAWNTYIATPVSMVVQAVVEFFAGLWQNLLEAATAWFQWWGSVLYDWFVKPWVDLGAYLLEATVALWEAIRGPIAGFFSWFGELLYKAYVEPWVRLGEAIANAAAATWNWVREAVVGFFSWFGSVVNQYLVAPISNALVAIREWFSSVWTAIKEFLAGWFAWWGDTLYKAFVEPWAKLGELLVKAAVQTWEWIQQAVASFFTWFGSVVKGYLVDPIQNALASVREWFVNAFNGVKEFLAGWFGWWADFFYKAFVEPIELALKTLGRLFVDGFAAVRDALSSAFERIREVWTNVATAMGEAWAGFIRGVQQAWSNVASAFVSNVITPIKDAWASFSSTLADVFKNGINAVANAMGGLAQAFGDYVVRPIGQAWADLVGSLATVMSSISSTFSSIWTSISSALVGAFNAIGAAFVDNVATPIKTAWESIGNVISQSLNGAVSAVSKAYSTIAGAVTGAFKGVVGTVGRIINSIIGALNKLIAGVNKVRAAVGLSGFSFIPEVNIPAYAKGGVVSSPTLALVGEAGEEYIIPASRMAEAAQNYLDGLRGESVLNARPRVDVGSGVPGGASGSPSINVSPTFNVGAGNTSVSITTGPVQQIGGERYVTVEDLQKAVASASRQARDAVLRDLAQPGTRARLGIS